MNQQHNAIFLAESWRFWQTMSEVLLRLDSSEVKRLVSKADYFKDCMTNFATHSELRVDIPYGREFNIGLPLQALNISDFKPEDLLYVSQVLQPTILDKDGRVVMEGKVMLAKQEGKE